MAVRLDEKNPTLVEAQIAKGAFFSGLLIGGFAGLLFGAAVILSLSIDVKQNYRTLIKGGLDRGHLQYEHNDKGEAILEWAGDETDSTTTGPAREAEHAHR